MLYIIGLALAFIFGFIYGVGWEKRRLDDAAPLDLDLTEQDLLEPEASPLDKQESSSLETPIIPMKHLIFYTYGGYDN